MEHFDGVKRLFIATMISFFLCCLASKEKAEKLHCWLIVDNKLNLLNILDLTEEEFLNFSPTTRGKFSGKQFCFDEISHLEKFVNLRRCRRGESSLRVFGI
jgi:hypothetical protein